MVLFSAMFCRKPVTIQEGSALALSYPDIAVVFLEPLEAVPARLWRGVVLVSRGAVSVQKQGA